ncbi:histidine phosphatase family protein [Roseococcus sp. SYP-B2431]|uniref:histidine phosphatase family protein n=1 Tax=Roseococcus sp. SYP-B2431 TaxID=2496640 RepID=UPI0010400F8A|nr:histidine phosphatase family protein [Roseococcus sp. SYP-B2431]TCH98132.1 histidine phosphatase family protein [Roseococcus sp. SYP-B2431]
MALTLHLLRHAVHGHPAEMLCGRMAGVGLAAEGERQAARLARRFALGSLDALRTSPVQRCRETAAGLEAACGLAAIVDPAADEVDFGDWTGRRFGDLERDPLWRTWNLDRGHAGAPGGETMARVRARVVALLDELVALHPQGEAAVVTHAEIVRTAVLHVLGLPLQSYDRLEISPASVTTLCLWPGGGRLIGLNDVSHITAPVPTKEVEPA